MSIAAQPVAAAEAAEPATIADSADPLAPVDEAASADTGQPPEAVMQLASWVTTSGDNQGMSFVVIDKVAAAVFAYNTSGQFLGAAPALLGSTLGDDSVPGIGERELSAVGTDARTTPAGRFLARLGPALGHSQVLWVDFPTSLALHPVVTDNKREHRLQRLRSPSSADNRITYGCINVSAGFYEQIVRPLFADTHGVVYILPESRSLNEVFPAFWTQHPDLISQAPPSTILGR